MNYWEMRKSFWTTRNGVIMMMASAISVIVGSVILINVLSSPFPIIDEFDADPEFIAPGEASILSWKITGAEFIQINPGIGAVSHEGSIVLRPEATTVYTLNATNGSVTHSMDARITVL